MKRTANLLVAVALVAALLAVGAPALASQVKGNARTASGRPDLSGAYDAATLTPLQRPVELGETAYLTLAEAKELAEAEQTLVSKANRNTGGNRDAPPVGGAAGVGFEDNPEAFDRIGAGNVGGYNWFWIDRGTDAFGVDGQFPTSIIIDPPNGRMPTLTPAAVSKAASPLASFRANDGTAWWLDIEGPGPYDGPESLPMRERCMLGFTGATPTLPSVYNNFKRIIQTEDHVMILIEMVHDARIVRMNSEHPGSAVKNWLGDSIGRWDGDTLVIDTTNFHPQASQLGGSENLHVVERFTPQVDGNMLYNFTVEDASVWTAPWTGEYIWRASDERVYEYACHEGNYAMLGILRGARLLESEAMAKRR